MTSSARSNSAAGQRMTPMRSWPWLAGTPWRTAPSRTAAAGSFDPCVGPLSGPGIAPWSPWHWRQRTAGPPPSHPTPASAGPRPGSSVAALRGPWLWR